MATEVKVPAVGESITEVQIGNWLKPEGAELKRDEAIVTIESDKATVEVSAPESGVLTRVLKHPGDSAKVGEVIAYVEPAAAPKAPPVEAPRESAGSNGQAQPPADGGTGVSARANAEAEAPAPPMKTRIMPSAQRVLAEHGLSGEEVEPTGPGGRLLKEDVLRYVEQHERPAAQGSAQRRAPEKAPELAPASAAVAPPSPPPPLEKPKSPARPGISQDEDVVRMSPMRRTIARRLIEAQQTAALLTSFNEIDMSAVMSLRKQHQEAFQARYNIKLGLMSFFVKAAVDALRLVPQVNAEIRGEDIVYRNHFDIGIAVGGGKGLVVPVIRDAEHMSFSQIERAIDDFSRRAKENKIELSELQGGTFTITNGGVYGSLLSTPIVNPPQSGILGLHAIQDRPVAREGQVVIRPMMYVALTYDHRLIDGREAVIFLKRIKDCIESPARMLIET